MSIKEAMTEENSLEHTQVTLQWLWPAIIILSAVAAGLVTFGMKDTLIRPPIVMWFLFVCPGMVLVRFFRLHNPAVEWTLAIAFSFAIDAIVAGIQMYAGEWSPTVTLRILIVLSLGGAIVQLVTTAFALFCAPGQTITALARKPDEIRKLDVMIALLLLLLIAIIVGASFWSHGSTYFLLSR